MQNQTPSELRTTEYLRNLHGLGVTPAQYVATDCAELLAASEALLHKIDHLTTEQFVRGGERAEREALRAIIARIGGAK